MEAVQAANDVEHRRFTRPRLAQNCDEFAISEGDRNVIERDLTQIRSFVDLDDISQFEHWDSFDRYSLTFLRLTKSLVGRYRGFPWFTLRKTRG